MKKYYVISLIVTFATAVVCLGITSVAIYGWSSEDQNKAAKFLVDRTSAKTMMPFRDRKEVSRSAEVKPYVMNAGKIDEVKLIVNLGNVVVVGAETSDIKFTPQDLEDGCEVVVSEDKNELRVEILKKDSKSSGCEGGVVAEVPAKTKIEVDNAKGDVSISKVIGDIDVSMGAGHVTVLDAQKEVKVKLAAGDLEISGNSNDINAKVGVGRIMAKLTQKIENGEWSFENGAGDIEVQIPMDQIAEEKLKVGMGEVKKSNIAQEASNFKIEARSGVGSVAVVKK